MLFGHQLTCTAQIFSDVRTFWSPAAVKRVTGKSLTGDAQGGIIHLINSGSTTMDGTGRQSRNGKPVMKPYWEITPDEAAACLDATHFCPADVGYFRGGGFSSEFETRGGMPVTMARLNMAAGIGPVLQIAEGSTVDLPREVAAPLEQRTNPTWPTTWFVPRVTGSGAFRDVYSVMNNWGANHGAISCGHIGADLIALASILRIPVSMHNVPAEKVFRPKYWASFGDAESESADYRACAALGPLYGK
jgi:L-fucose isomerase